MDKGKEMKPRKRHLTARIKPATKHALMAQLALAAEQIIELQEALEWQRTKASVAFLCGAAAGTFAVVMAMAAS